MPKPLVQGINGKKVIDRIYKLYPRIYRHISQTLEKVRYYTDILGLKVLKYRKNKREEQDIWDTVKG